jgi:hypothetical protein
LLETKLFLLFHTPHRMAEETTFKCKNLLCQSHLGATDSKSVIDAPKTSKHIIP